MKFKRLAMLIPTFIVILILSSCTTSPPALTGVPALDADKWNEFAGGGDTKCADGTDYKYYAHKGSENKLVIDFMGGGACWDAISCSALGSYTKNVVGSSPSEQGYNGIYDRSNADNPVKDWYHVFTPYCTGDTHIGNNVVDYDDPLNPGTPNKVYHRGAINAKAVLDWTFANFDKPESIFVTGCSAGAYGAAAWTETIRKHYGPDVDLSLLGDCGAGISAEGFEKVIGAAWGVENSSVLQGRDFTNTFTQDTYIATANSYPDVTLAQYNTTRDSTQIGFYSFGKGVTDPGATEVFEWATGMQTSMGNIDIQTENFASYVAEHDADPITTLTQHCVINRPDLYQVSQSGTSLITWITDLVNGNPVRSVSPPQAN